MKRDNIPLEIRYEKARSMWVYFYVLATLKLISPADRSNLEFRLLITYTSP